MARAYFNRQSIQGGKAYSIDEQSRVFLNLYQCRRQLPKVDRWISYCFRTRATPWRIRIERTPEQSAGSFTPRESNPDMALNRRPRADTRPLLIHSNGAGRMGGSPPRVVQASAPARLASGRGCA